MSGLVEHFENRLGPIEEGWNREESGAELLFQIVRFGRGPYPQSITFATLGFHRRGLESRTTGRHIHQEFVMTVPSSVRGGPIPGILQQVALEAQTNQAAILRGDVIRPRGPLVANSQMEAINATVPTFYPDDFGTCREGAVSIAIVWLVPIAHSEAHVIWDRGWEAFEDILENQQPDLVDIYRHPIRIDPESD